MRCKRSAGRRAMAGRGKSGRALLGLISHPPGRRQLTADDTGHQPTADATGPAESRRARSSFGRFDPRQNRVAGI
jgi:hypothetical protein